MKKTPKRKKSQGLVCIECGKTGIQDAHAHEAVCPGPNVPERMLLTGEVVKETQHLQALTLTTKAPRKWLMVDLEMGHVWKSEAQGNGMHTYYAHAGYEVIALANGDIRLKKRKKP